MNPKAIFSSEFINLVISKLDAMGPRDHISSANLLGMLNINKSFALALNAAGQAGCFPGYEQKQGRFGGWRRVRAVEEVVQTDAAQQPKFEQLQALAEALLNDVPAETSNAEETASEDNGEPSIEVSDDSAEVVEAEPLAEAV